MKLKIKAGTKVVFSVLLTNAMALQPVAAQEDFGGDFNSPPPPPDLDMSAPTSPGGFGGTDSGAGTDSGGGGGAPGNTRGLLTPTQKQKFAKAGIEDINDKNFPETIESFDFPNADLQDIVKAISELTGKNFIIDNGLRGKITIIAPSKITVAEAYKAFLSALAINGFAIVPQGKFLKIRSARNAQRDSIETYSGNYYPNADQMITRIIHLKHISAEAVNRDLRILSSKDGEMSIYPPTNSIILSDYGSNIDRVMKIISQLDVPGFEDQLEVIPVKYAKAKDIAELIDKIVNKGQGQQGGGNRGGFTAGVPRFTRNTNTKSSQGSAYYMVIPDDRTNSLIVVGNKAGIARIKKLLTQLDFRMRPEDTGGVYVYYVRNGDAKKIAATLQGVAKDAAPKPATGGSAPPALLPQGGVATPQEIFGGDVKIQADEGTNSLVIVASKQDYEVVLSLLRKIDIPRDQVYVEAIIMEMKSTDALDYQIGYFKYLNESGAKVGFSGFNKANLADLLNPVGGSGTILGFGSNDTMTITPPSLTGAATPIKINSLVGFINFLKKNANANILSTPQLLALDAQEAMISVGDKVVVGAQATPGINGAPPIVTPSFEDANIELKIKPFISPTSNSIRMELKSNIKQLSIAKTPADFQNSTQPLATRKLETTIVVRNGDTAVLGGLMKEDDVEDIRKVPLLGDIPILGWLFKSRSTSKEKTNMLIFLTPKIVRTASDSNKLLSDKIKQRQKYVEGTGGRDPYGAKIDEIQKRRAKSSSNDDLE